MSIKSIVKSILRRFGLAIYSIPSTKNQLQSGHQYSQSHPNATLAPWLSNAEFMNVFELAKHNTLVDIYRLHELWTLVEETAKVGGDIVEIGVWRGGSGCLMASCSAAIDSETTVYLCDTFEGVVKAGDKDSSYKGGEHKDTSIEILEDLSDKLGIKNVKILKGIFPEDTGDMLESKRIRLCHIDVDVYQSAQDSIDHIWGRMPVGGAFVFDDYGFVGCEGITRCVDDMRHRGNVFYFNNLNGHAVLIKMAD